MLDEKRFAKAPARETTNNVIMENRKKVSISGVEDVESFDEDSIILYTGIGVMNIKGEDLHINKLSIESGEVVIEGEINSITYTDSDGRSGGGFLGRLFK